MKLPVATVRRRTAFTLLELLIVVAMVALLIATLLPVFSSVRARSNQAKSLSNLRQFGSAFTSYATENNNRLPPIADWSGGSYKADNIWDQKSWDYYLWSYLGVPGASVSQGDSTPPDKNFEKIFFHPGDQAAASVKCRRSYAMVWNPPLGLFTGYQPGGDVASRGGPLSLIPNSANLILLTERPGYKDNLAGGGAYADCVTPQDAIDGQCSTVNGRKVSTLNPGGVFDYLFADGHVQTLDPKDTVGQSGTLTDPKGMWRMNSQD